MDDTTSHNINFSKALRNRCVEISMENYFEDSLGTQKEDYVQGILDSKVNAGKILTGNSLDMVLQNERKVWF
jgi:hypothetical protein